LEFCIFLTSLRKALRAAQSPSCPVRTGDFSVGLKWLGKKTENLAPTIVEVKRAWIYESTPIKDVIAYCPIS
jgi:hypothetical protein